MHPHDRELSGAWRRAYLRHSVLSFRHCGALWLPELRALWTVDASYDVVREEAIMFSAMCPAWRSALPTSIHMCALSFARTSGDFAGVLVQRCSCAPPASSATCRHAMWLRSAYAGMPAAHREKLQSRKHQSYTTPLQLCIDGLVRRRLRRARPHPTQELSVARCGCSHWHPLRHVTTRTVGARISVFPRTEECVISIPRKHLITRLPAVRHNLTDASALADKAREVCARSDTIGDQPLSEHHTRRRVRGWPAHRSHRQRVLQRGL
jgi:hypothetical protein